MIKRHQSTDRYLMNNRRSRLTYRPRWIERFVDLSTNVDRALIISSFIFYQYYVSKGSTTIEQKIPPSEINLL